MRLNSPFHKIWDHLPLISIVGLIERSNLSDKHSGNIRQINNLDKGCGNTLQSFNQAIEKIKTNSICIALKHDIKRKETYDN